LVHDASRDLFLPTLGKVLTAFNLDKASQTDSTDAASYVIRGYHNKNTEHDLAIADFTKAIKLHPKSTMIYELRGDVYDDIGHRDLAIADYTEALRDRPSDEALYRKRGFAYLGQDKYELAIGDYSEIIELKRAYRSDYFNRGFAYLALGKSDLAIADITNFVEGSGIAPYMRSFAPGGLPPGRGESIPRGDPALFTRGSIRLVTGDFAGASSDEAEVIKQENDAYAMITLYLAQLRLGNATAETEFMDNISRLKTKAWPYAIIELYLGVRTPAATLKSASDPEQRCEAQFYIGEWHIVRRRIADARATLKAAIESCPKYSHERLYALAELKRL
jgi:lipoprotein NlpI